MAWTVPAIAAHPVDWSFWPLTLSLGFTAHPTDLLKACLNSAKPFVPKSKDKASVYQNASAGDSTSLLWGCHLGFGKRCSRGILVVSPSLLTLQPTFGVGHDGRAMCLAYGILTRNQGPAPHRLMCNLQSRKSLQRFEDNSQQWPRPSRNLRSLYQAEFSRTFALLGESYVLAATELALLLADTSNALVEDWMDGQMEQQDLSLNREVADLGASSVELDRLYRGQYAVMLVSLATHQKGTRVRPEILVYDALAKLEGVGKAPEWMLEPVIAKWRRQELDHIGPRGQKLVAAII